MIDFDIAHRTLTAIMQPGDLFADLFAERATLAACHVRGDAPSDIQVRAHQGIGIRRLNNAQTHYTHTPDLSEAGLHTIARALRDGEALKDQPSATPADEFSDDMPIEEMLSIAREVATEAERCGGPQLKAEVTVRAMRQVVLIIGSDGRVAREVRCFTKMRIEAVVEQKRKVRNSQRQVGAPQITDLRQDGAHLRLAREAAESALNRLQAVEVPSGEMTVILGPGGPATLLHEACGHALEADLAQHTRSAYYGRLGEQVAASIVTLIDDPRTPRSAPLGQIDDEGEPAEPTVLIEGGILRDYLYDRRSALLVGRATNGHGRRLNYAYPPLPRMSTTYVAPGDFDPEEIMRETKRGLFVQSISGGDTDMGSGRFNLQVDEGYLVEDGQITAPIRGAMLSGLGPEILRAIDRVGDDCRFMTYCYVCNKLDQFPLPVSVGQPTLRVPRLLVWGS